MTRAIGIDLGTTYSVAAVIEDGRPQIIPNAEGQRLTPSVVAFTKDGRPIVGQMAKRQAAANPERTVFSIKRRMGSEHTVRVGEREYTPQEISSLILRKVKKDAEDHLGEGVEKAVITVPAYFSDRQRQATKEAGLLAGLDVIRVINEPTAAALAYGLDREDLHTVLVWDLGGGTFDISILELDQGIFEVRAVSGNTWLGGDDYDQRVMDYLAQEYSKTQGTAFPSNGMARQRLREAAERAKIQLSRSSSVDIRLPFIAQDSGLASHLEATLTRDRFQELTAELAGKMVAPTLQALADVGLEPREIDRVILVGGATRMPAVWELARQLLGKEPYQSVDPDEVVAMGAAIQAGMLLGQVRKTVLLDVIPLSLGIETQGGLFAKIIPRNTPLPASAAHIFTTAADNQSLVDIHVLQGERALAEDNISLGQFQLRDIPSLPKGIPKIGVAFDVDIDGIVHVCAEDLLTGGEESIRLVSTKGLHPEDVESLVHEAESNVEADGERRERIQAGIQADNAISMAEALMEENYARGTKKQAEEIDKAILRVKGALATGKGSEIRYQSSALMKLCKALQEGNAQGRKTSPLSHSSGLNPIARL